MVDHPEDVTQTTEALIAAGNSTGPEAGAYAVAWMGNDFTFGDQIL